MRIKLYCYESEHSDTSIQACNQLGTPGGAKSFLGGAKFFELCPVVLNDVQHIFPGGSKIFLGGFWPLCPSPGYAPASIYCRKPDFKSDLEHLRALKVLTPYPFQVASPFSRNVRLLCEVDWTVCWQGLPIFADSHMRSKGAVAILRGVWVGHGPPVFFLAPVWLRSFFLNFPFKFVWLTYTGLPNAFCKNTGHFVNSARSELCHNS